jgi:dihydroorotate dehydrogenase
VNWIESFGLSALRLLDPETAHGLALKALRTPFAPLPGPVTSARLKTSVAGLDLPNPVGLAAGFDKNATVIAKLSRAGFGFIELGAATPRAQPGNPKPRLFRLTEDNAAINRFGFNNDGMHAIAARLKTRPTGIPVGLNLGANKDSADRTDDFVQVLNTCGPFIDFATVNVSSPNTANLRDLQGRAALTALLENVILARSKLAHKIPIFLKIAPDLTDADLTDIAEVAISTGMEAIIATNTTLSRDNLQSPHRDQAGGLSGAPLFETSTRVLARLAQLTAGKIPLIGVGGISSAEDAYTKIKAGACAVQLYTAMIFRGLSLATTIARELDILLARDGFNNVAEAVGIEMDNYK